MSPIPAEDADKQRGGGGGLVRNLLLPAFTDAGSNDTFAAEKQQSTSTRMTTPSAAEHDVAADSVISEASTTIHDNRSKKQREQGGGDARSNYYRSASSSPDNVNGFNSAERTRPPPFFASTRPPRSATASGSPARTSSTNANTDTNAKPTTRLVETPPPINRQDIFVSGGRSLSTVAMARGEGYISLSDGDLETFENTVLLDPNREPLTPLALADDKNADAMDRKDKENDSNEDASAERAQETTEASPPHLEKEEIQQQQQQQQEDEPISELQETINKQQNIVWEEEATPDQTAFGKQLIFQRQFGKEASRTRDDSGEAAASEVLSTASEMGTVIDMARLNELDEDAERMIAESPPSEQVVKNQQYDLNMPDLYRTSRDTATGAEREENKRENETNSPQRKHKKEDTGKDHPIDFNEKAASILAQAIRRIGSGLGGAGGGVSRAVGGTNSISAPSTPKLGPHVGGYSHHHHQSGPFWTPGRSSTEDDHQNHPSSFLLRSPGSAAFELASSAQKEKKKKSMLSPRFASRFSKNMEFHRSNVVDSRIDEDKATELQRALEHPRGSTAFQIARSCFSFDAYDTTMDDMCEVPFLDTQIRLPIKARGQSGKSVRWPDGNQEKPSFPIIADDEPPAIRSSLSWDVGGSSQASPPFRPAPFRPSKINPNLFESPKRRPPQVDMMSDFSRTPRSDAMELKTPERIKIEREDALDILACLVERGVSLKQQYDKGEESTMDLMNDTGNERAADETATPSVESSVAELKTLIRKDTAEGSDSENESRHHLAVLDELVRSHEYAQEMRRASQSALSWLKSIGRSLESTSGADGEARLDLVSRNSGDTPSAEQAAGEDASEGMNLLTARAMLHSAQLELKEKSDLAERLNEELAQCRAEIGRLKSAAQSTSFRSPNRSILDENDDVSAADEPDEEEELERSFDDSSPIVGVDESGFLGSSFLEKHTSAEVSSSTAAAYRAALEKANEQIRMLYEQLRQKTEGNDEGVPDQEAPVVNIDEVEEKARVAANESPSNKRERTVDIEVLDAENFVTEWTELVPPLPPPPDHGLHSPIVEAVLDQWSNSPELHTSLLDWMDQVLSGGDSDSIPPLTLSNLDCQVRDGFVTHILPLLLRRPDILVDVKTRVQRLTTYDLAVTVEPTGDQAVMPLHVRRHLETTSAQSDVGVGSTANSSATTALIANGVMARKPSMTNGSAPNHLFTETGAHHHGSRLSYDEMAETGLGVGPPSGLMSTLGNTLGGLLTRRAGAGGHTSNSHKGVTPVAVPELTSSSVTPYETAQAANTTAAAAQALFAAELSTSSEHAEQRGGATVYLDEATNCDQPYHRVVSAPPGRIGVTFVEYRGHAMVSDVADDSPLSGWIFPSDIVIAIDEKPVSGMRVRDIIKILKDRAGRQRAMRVISSHAMNEFTLNSSALLVDGPS